MRIGLDEVDELRKADRQAIAKKTLAVGLAALAVFLVFLNMSPSHQKFFSPLQTLDNFRLWAELAWANLTGRPTAAIYNQFPDDIFWYQITFIQVKRMAVCCACGMMLTLSGMVYQCVFRNPIAAPTVLGVTNGVNLAILYLVVLYGSAVTYMPLEKYKLSYIGAGTILAAVMALGKLSSGRGRFSVSDLLLVGVATSAIVGAVMTAIMNGLDESVLLTYQEVIEASSVLYDKVSLICVAVIFGATFLPMLLLRFSFNAASYSPDEMRGLGMHPGRVRVASLVLATVMVTASVVHCGTVGMLSLAVPHVSRYIFGSDFKKSFWGNLFLGGALLMLCRGVADMIPFGYEVFPVGVVANVVVAPIFACFMARSKRGWE